TFTTLTSNLGTIRAAQSATISFNSGGATHFNGGDIIIDTGSTINFGPAGARDPLPNSNPAGAFKGTINVENGSKLNAGDFTNPGPNATLRVADAGSIATFATVTNGGFVIVDPGGVINSAAVTNTGAITIDSAGSAWNTSGSNFGTTGGQVSVTRGGRLNL